MPIRVLVVDDSLTVRKRLVEVLAGDPAFEVVGEGCNGRDAIKMTQRLRPDIVTLDMMMPGMSGLAATEYIMAYCPTPILIVSASVNRPAAMRTLDALAAGAVDVLDKPSGGEDDEQWERQFRSAVRIASRVKVITHPRARLAPHAQAAVPTPAGPQEAGAGTQFIAIGASTGGPQALMTILPALPRDFDLPILLVVHIDARFDASFREWLDGVAQMPVRHAADGAALPRRGDRGVWLAPADRHLVVDGDSLRLRYTAERHSCRPSVDELFESVARGPGKVAAGVLLTGMGADGAAGLLEMRRAGSLTIAQDEASSTIFGMPAEAIRRGAACRVLGVHEIAPALAALHAEARTRRST